MSSPMPLPRCRRRTAFGFASISTISAAPPNWPIMARRSRQTAGGARGRRSRDPSAAQHGGPHRIPPGSGREPPADRNRAPLTLATIDQSQASDVVGLFGAGGEFGRGSEDLFDEPGGPPAPLAIEDIVEPRLAENLAGRVERLGDAVGEHEQRVAGREHGFGDRI